MAHESRPLGPFRLSPIGLGAMRLTGPGVFGPPADRDEAIRLLREAVASGIDHIDTAQYYGPAIANELIREALHPYRAGLTLVSKVGAARDGRGGVIAFDEPAQLRQGIEDNLRSLGVDMLPVVNLRLMRGGEVDAFFDDQLAAMTEARDEGLIGAVGLSNVTLPQLLHGLAPTELACVQNAFNLANRRSQPIVDECTRRGVAFVPFWPLGAGSQGGDAVLEDPRVKQVAHRVGSTPGQVALAWLLQHAPNVLLIPGTSSRVHLRENLAAGALHLDEQAVRELSEPGGAKYE